MRILLDTQIALWLAASPAKLSERALELAQDAGQELLLSTASAWEISITYAAEKLPLPTPPAEFLPELQRRLQLSMLSIELSHAVHAGSLPLLHRDPFDRMLVAQAQLLRVPIMTVDPKVARYDVEIVDG
jgi:PIN domain nuclease of toxin-antitoxin system